MRTKRPVLAAVVALGLFVVTSGSVLAQLTVPEQDDYETALRGDSILRFPPVLDAPFSAEALAAWQPRPNSGRSEWRAPARYYRDRSGRVRVEQMFVGHASGQSPQRVIVAPDPDSLTVYVLDPVARTATKVPRMYAVMTVGDINHAVMPISMTCFISFFRLQTINPFLDRHGQARIVIDEESLGEQTMAGVQVAGTRFRTKLPAGLLPQGRRDTQMAYERWISSELKVEVYGRNEDSENDVVEHRLTTISRAEPPAELFEVPADYEVTVGDRISPTRWLNPYAPEIWPARSSPAERCDRPW